MKALLLENIHPDAVSHLTAAGYEVEQRPASLSERDLALALTGVSLLGIRSNTSVTQSVLEAAPNLRAVGCFCIGTNQVDLVAASRAGVAVFNAPYSNSRSVVELVIGEIIALARRLVEKTELMHAGVWDKSAKGSHEIRGRTLGIIGYGNIGTQLANVAESLGMRVIFYDVADRPAHGNAQRVGSPEDLLRDADVVSLHVDGRPGNAGLFGAPQFAAMKDGALFINASRGMVVDDEALRDNILSGHLGGAALDVFPIEPKAQGDPFKSVLLGLDNVILTPHVAASTLEAQEEIGTFVSTKLLNFVNQGSTALSVNLPEALVPSRTRGSRIACLYTAQTRVITTLTSLLQDQGATITGQYVATRGELGYVVTDVDRTPTQDMLSALQKTPGVRWTHHWNA